MNKLHLVNIRINMVKKDAKSLNIRTAIIACVLIVAVTLSLILACLAISGGSKETSGIMNYVVVIDAGHGGIDGGAVGVNTGNLESELNLLVANELKKDLESFGVKVVMTRKDNRGLYESEGSGFKREDMVRRAKIIAEAKPSLVVSIHMNKFPLRYRRGAQVYFQKGSSDSQALANVLQSSLNADINLVHSKREYSALGGDFYVCKTSPCPAVIVECGFLSNAEDDALLDTPSYRSALAHSIYSGIAEYIALMTFNQVADSSIKS